MVHRLRYRLWQFWQIVQARPLPHTAHQHIATLLTPAEQTLFARFSPADQAHSYRVMRLLEQHGHTDPALLAAALLHDVGKTQVHLTWWDRVIVVIGVLAGRTIYTRWGEGAVQGWHKGVVVRVHHPDWGAQMAAAAGSHALTVALIRRHQEKLPPNAAATRENELLRLLQWADDQN